MFKKIKEFFGYHERLEPVEDMEQQLAIIDETYDMLSVARKADLVVSFDIRVKGMTRNMVVRGGDSPVVEWIMNYLAGLKQSHCVMIEEMSKSRLSARSRLLRKYSEGHEDPN
jgi:hypothetical protein